jgi:glycine reductase complex component B subunit gamma
MVGEMRRVVLYLNQFFGGIGGEDKADLPPRLTEDVVGPGRAYKSALDDQAEVVATVICGDNYFAENIEAATREVKELIAPYQPDLLFAGPAFNAGRYGIACGAVCRMARTELLIPAVTGMYEENPGLDLYRKDVYIVKTGDNARFMADVVKKMTALGLRLLAGDKIGRPDDEGYYARGVLANEVSDRTGAERVVDMLLQKMRGEPYLSEVPRPAYDRVTPAPALRDIRLARIALVTDGGLVPKGNPDKIEVATATRYGRYDIGAKERLDSADYEVNHGGYDSRLVVQDPNRLVPVDVMREMEREGAIGSLHNWFYSTTGLTCIVEVMKGLGGKIAESLKAEGVSGVILTST